MSHNLRDAISVVCFGEVLWDQLGSESRPGGAPMNVSYHLRQFGLKSAVISRLGEDELGEEILDILNHWGIDTSCCTMHATEPTGIAKGTMDDQHEVGYEIVEPAAWDFIPSQKYYTQKVMTSDLFIYGSLSSRSKVSEGTLMELLQVAPFKVFDVNLREPFYNKERIQALLQHADLLKLNTAELKVMNEWYAPILSNEGDMISFIQNTFSIPEILLTRGNQGASYYTASETQHRPALSVEVKDTIGSGDAFLAGFLAQRKKGASPSSALRAAAILAAFVTTQKGACPNYDPKEIIIWAEKQKWND